MDTLAPASTTVMSKRALLVASHAIERAFAHALSTDTAVGRQAPGLLIGLFQRREYFDVEATRYATLAAAGHTVVVGFTGSTAGLPPGVHGVSLHEEEPLAADWVLTVTQGQFAASLVAHDNHQLSAAEATLEASRLFLGRFSMQRHVALADAEGHLDQLADRLPREVAERARQQLRDASAVPLSPVEERLAVAADHLIGSVDVGYRRAMVLRAELEDTRTVAERDQLTGLHNRHYLERYLGSGDRPADLVALLVDVDGLKSVNDEHGHEAGDAVLRTVADALRSGSRSTDVVVRWGGDEFLVLVPHLSAAAGLEHGQRLTRAVLESRPQPPWETLRPSVSIGVTPARRTPLPLARLDAALQEVKHAGKGHAALSRS